MSKREALICLIIILMNINNSLSKCYSYYTGDKFPQTNNSYCAGIIQWSVSDQTFSTYEQRDKKALDNYKQLYQQLYKNSIVTTDCLGMAKYFFCADAYPTCNNDTSSIPTMCSWVCRLWSVRCGEDNKFFQEICQSKTVAADTCSWNQNIFFMYGLLIIILLLTF